MRYEEMKEEELKETLELVKRVFDEFEAPDYTDEGVTNFYKFIDYDSILEQLKDNFKIFVAKVEEQIIGMVCIVRMLLRLFWQNCIGLKHNQGRQKKQIGRMRRSIRRSWWNVMSLFLRLRII